MFQKNRLHASITFFTLDETKAGIQALVNRQFDVDRVQACAIEAEIETSLTLDLFAQWVQRVIGPHRGVISEVGRALPSKRKTG
jgi:hypothetical protein